MGKVASWIIMQGLACSLVGKWRGYSCSERMVKRLDVARCSDNQHTGAHRHYGIDASLDQARRHATEDIVQCTHRALAGIEDGQANSAILQDLGQFLGRNQLLLICYYFPRPSRRRVRREILLHNHCRGKTPSSTRLDRSRKILLPPPASS